MPREQKANNEEPNQEKKSGNWSDSKMKAYWVLNASSDKWHSQNRMMQDIYKQITSRLRECGVKDVISDIIGDKLIEGLLKHKM